MLLWLGSSILLVPVLYVVVGTSYVLVDGSRPFADRVLAFLIGIVLFARPLGYFGAAFAVIGALPYGPVLYLWSIISRRTSVLDKNTLHVAIFTAMLALPTAVAGSLGAAEFAGSIQWREALATLPVAFLVPWGALLVPRVAIRRLQPGAFIEDRTAA